MSEKISTMFAVETLGLLEIKGSLRCDACGGFGHVVSVGLPKK
jgi:hypothetical protein